MRILFIRAKLGVVKVSSLVVRSQCRTNRKQVLAYPGSSPFVCVSRLSVQNLQEKVCRNNQSRVQQLASSEKKSIQQLDNMGGPQQLRSNFFRWPLEVATLFAADSAGDFDFAGVLPRVSAASEMSANAGALINWILKVQVFDYDSWSEVKVGHNNIV